MCVYKVQLPMEAKKTKKIIKALNSPGAGVTGGCQPPDVGAKN